MTGGSEASGLLTAPKPSFGVSEAERVADRWFGKRGSATELGGERDQNFRLDTREGASFLLKISNPAEDEAALSLQTAGMRHVERTAPALPVMEPVPTVEGEPWASVAGSEGASHFVRLFTFLPGRMAAPRELDSEALFEFGAVVAEVGEALRGFFHPEARYDILWDLRNTPRLRDRVDAVGDEGRRALTERLLDRFDDRVAPVFGELRAQVIHNDLTFANVLFGDDDRVSGVVDFGDLTHTALVCDLAVSLASAMFEREDPLRAAEAVTRGYVSVTPLEDAEARLLGDLVAARLVAWVVIAAWRVEDHPENAEYITSGVESAWALLERLDEVGLEAVGRRLRTAAVARNVPYDTVETDALRSRREAVMGSSPIFYRDPIHVAAGEGVWLFDPEGRRYLDAYNNVQVVGHANPVVADAIAGQARKLSTHSRYLHESVVELGERLTSTMPSGLDTALFVNSGSEANDLAMRMARTVTGGSGAIVTERAYHGITAATTDLSPEVWPEGYHPDDVETVPPPDGGAAGSPDRAVEATGDAVAALAERGPGTAAFVFDSLFTSDGVRPPTGESLSRMAARVRDAGGLVVADEVQSGYGRAGPHLWGFDAAGVTPDVVTLGKPMGNGHPVAAVVTRAEIAEALMDETGVFSTFGGNPVSSAAALAVLDVVEDEGLPGRADAVGDYLREGLTALRDSHDCLGEVRGRGLMTGVELVADGETGAPASRSATAEVVNGLRERRVLIGSTGPCGNVLKIRPPLVFERRHADRLLEKLDAVLGDGDV